MAGTGSLPEELRALTSGLPFLGDASGDAGGLKEAVGRARLMAAPLEAADAAGFGAGLPGAPPGGDAQVSRFSCGDTVDVWSNSGQRWYPDGVVTNTSRNGDVEVLFDGSRSSKEVAAAEAGQMLRRRATNRPPAAPVLAAPASTSPRAPSGLARGGAVEVWSKSLKRWFKDGIIESVSAQGDVDVQYDFQQGVANCSKTIGAGDVAEMLKRRASEPPASSGRSRGLPFEPGQAVDVWSNSQGKWFEDGLVDAVAPDGSVEVLFDFQQGTASCSKSLAQEDVSSVLRLRATPSAASAAGIGASAPLPWQVLPGEPCDVWSASEHKWFTDGRVTDLSSKGQITVVFDFRDAGMHRTKIIDHEDAPHFIKRKQSESAGWHRGVSQPGAPPMAHDRPQVWGQPGPQYGAAMGAAMGAPPVGYMPPGGYMPQQFGPWGMPAPQPYPPYGPYGPAPYGPYGPWAYPQPCCTPPCHSPRTCSPVRMDGSPHQCPCSPLQCSPAPNTPQARSPSGRSHETEVGVSGESQDANGRKDSIFSGLADRKGEVSRGQEDSISREAKSADGSGTQREKPALVSQPVTPTLRHTGLDADVRKPQHVIQSSPQHHSSPNHKILPPNSSQARGSQSTSDDESAGCSRQARQAASWHGDGTNADEHVSWNVLPARSLKSPRAENARMPKPTQWQVHKTPELGKSKRLLQKDATVSKEPRYGLDGAPAIILVLVLALMMGLCIGKFLDPPSVGGVHMKAPESSLSGDAGRLAKGILHIDGVGVAGHGLEDRLSAISAQLKAAVESR